MSNQKFTPCVITSTQLAEIEALLIQIEAILPHDLVNLTPGERKSIPKMGDKSDPFCNKSYDYGILIPGIIYSSIDIGNMKENIDSLPNLQSVRRKFQIIATTLDDTCLKIGSEIYKNALSIYKNVQDGAKRNVTGCKEAEVELKERFKQHKNSITPTTTPPPDTPPDSTPE